MRGGRLGVAVDRVAHTDQQRRASGSEFAAHDDGFGVEGVARSASTRPRVRPAAAMTRLATGSVPIPSSHRLGSSPAGSGGTCASWRLTSEMETTASRHPRLPQQHQLSALGSWVWPISPAMPRSVEGLAVEDEAGADAVGRFDVDESGTRARPRTAARPVPPCLRRCRLGPAGQTGSRVPASAQVDPRGQDRRRADDAGFVQRAWDAGGHADQVRAGQLGVGQAADQELGGSVWRGGGLMVDVDRALMLGEYSPAGFGDRDRAWL